jgi:hypothetical protein
MQAALTELYERGDDCYRSCCDKLKVPMVRSTISTQKPRERLVLFRTEGGQTSGLCCATAVLRVHRTVRVNVRYTETETL